MAASLHHGLGLAGDAVVLLNSSFQEVGRRGDGHYGFGSGNRGGGELDAGFIVTFGNQPGLSCFCGKIFAQYLLAARFGAVQRGMGWLERGAGALFLYFGVRLALSTHPTH